MREGWYYAEGSKSLGPSTFTALTEHLSKASDPGNVKVWHISLQEWQASKDVPQISDHLFRPPPVPQSGLEGTSTSPVHALAKGEASKGAGKNTRSRIVFFVFFVVLMVVLLIGAIFSGFIYRNSADGTAERTLKDNPSNAMLQLLSSAVKTASETDRLVQKLSNEIEPPTLADAIDYAKASRPELERYRSDLKIAEANATTAMPRYLALLKDEREKVEALAKDFDDETVRELLSGIDKRHASFTAFASKMLLARTQLYRSLGSALDIVIEQFGSYKIQTNGQFVFATQIVADRYTAAANEINAAANHVSELENEGKQLSQAQQESWKRFTSGWPLY